MFVSRTALRRPVPRTGFIYYARDVAFLNACLLRLPCAIRHEPRVLSGEFLGGHRILLRFLDDLHHQIRRLAAGRWRGRSSLPPNGRCNRLLTVTGMTVDSHVRARFTSRIGGLADVVNHGQPQARRGSIERPSLLPQAVASPAYALDASKPRPWPGERSPRDPIRTRLRRTCRRPF